MSQQIKFFTKNKIDLSFDDINITVTDSTATDTGQDFVDFVRNRNNNSAWLTTGSNDAAGTVFLVDMVDVKTVDQIILIGHNFKSFQVEYFDDASGTYEDFSPAINETTNTAGTNAYAVTSVETSQIRITINGTQTANADKQLKQLIVTESIGTGQFEGWPIVKPEVSLNRKVTPALSGKVSVVETQGSYKVDLSVAYWKSDNDLSIVEDLYFNRNGFLVWPCGGDETQFSSIRRGYRLEDIYFMKCVNEYKPEFYKGLYQAGIKLNIKLSEAV